jgi:hypothetical protein
MRCPLANVHVWLEAAIDCRKEADFAAILPLSQVADQKF